MHSKGGLCDAKKRCSSSSILVSALVGPVIRDSYTYFLVNCVEERPWRPIKSLNNEDKEEKIKRRGRSDQAY